MNKAIRRYGIFFLIFMASCLEELPFETTVKSQSLVVNGSIDNLKEDQVIHLSKTLAYGVPPVPLSNAKVSVLENNSKEYSFIESKPGEYVLNKENYDPRVGATYALSFTVDGQTYKSAAETLLPPIVPDSVTWTVAHETVLASSGIPRISDGVKLQIHTPLLNGNKNVYLKWDIQTAFQFSTLKECNPFKTLYTCYFGKTLLPSELRIYSNVDNGLSYLKGEDVGTESLDVGYQFVETHYYSIYQHRISAAAYDYYQKLRLVSEQNGTIFDPIPASVKSNVHNASGKNESIVGYFDVSSVAVIRKKLVAADFQGLYALPNKDYNYCGWRLGIPNSEYFPACCSCDELKDPKIQKPDWW